MTIGLLQDAARLAQGSKPELARPLINQLLQQDRDNPDVFSLLGLVASRTGDTDGAVDAFSRACQLDPDNPARLSNLGVSLKQAGRLDEAIAAIKKSLEIRPRAAGTLANLGSTLIAADRHEEALAPLHESVKLDFERPDGWNNLGVALAKSGFRNKAIVAYQKALELMPSHAEAALNLADATNEPEKGEAMAANVLRQNPGHARAANIVAAYRKGAGDIEGAIAIYQAALAHEPSIGLQMNLALALLQCNRPAEALEHIERVVDEAPPVTTALAYKCAALDKLGRSEDLIDLMAVDRLVTVHDLPYDPNFHAALERELRAHPSLTYEPEGLVTRAGRQSDDLASTSTPALSRLAQMARIHLGRRHAELGSGHHPWLRSKPLEWSLTMWGTILQPGGTVDPHIHAPNWLSGVYYPAVSAEIARGEEGGFGLGLFPEILGGGGDPTVLAARPGRLILFPSWLWHATLPFSGRTERVSFAFDLVPHGIGQKHRLKK